MRGDEKLNISNDSIEISGNTSGMVMHVAEKTVMVKLAELVTRNGGDILEVGFGMHLSADAVQTNPNVKSHTIIEVHPDIYQSALVWSNSHPNSEILFGDWIDVLPKLNKKFDGVLHDTHIDFNIPLFLDYIKPNCKKGTIVGFYEYTYHSNSISGLRVSLTEDEYKSLPYSHNTHFSTNSFELKYTIFDGENFVKDENIKGLI
jgi:hypothetical protein